jgi:type IV secretion system protein VirD4
MDEFTAMGRVVILNAAVAYLAGYNLRLLTVVQAMSQLDAVYGDKEARTFATNHGAADPLRAARTARRRRVQRHAGHFTERAKSGPQPVLQLGAGRQALSVATRASSAARCCCRRSSRNWAWSAGVIFENCKPILGEKIRYYRDKAFTSRLLKPPAVPRMDTDLHLARVQQRWRYADDELPAGQTLSLEALAHDHTLLPDSFEGPPDKVADELLTFFDKGAPGIPGIGGSIEPVADEDDVLLADSDATVMTLDVAALDADIDVAPGVEPGPQEIQIVP